MKTIVLKKKNLDYRPYIRRHAKESDVSTIIKEDVKVLDEDGNIIILYYKIDPSFTKNLKWACQTIPYATSARSSGLVTTSTIFGYEPSKGIRKEYCSATKLATSYPKQHYIITNFGKKLAKIYKKEIPDIYNKHIKIVNDKLKNNWRLTETPFTSGIINKNNYLAYHLDSGNFQSVYSNMIVLKNQVRGGYLICPEFDVGFEVADNTLIMFDGQNILHGVSKIHYKNKLSYRYSIVYYSLQQMWNCKTIDEELLKIREVKQLRQLKKSEKM